MKKKRDKEIDLFVSSGTSRVTVVKEGKFDDVIVTYYPVRFSDQKWMISRFEHGILFKLPIPPTKSSLKVG